MIAISIVIILVVVGAFFGLLLAFANSKLAVKTDPLVHAVDDVLPKGQCGACGFAGCMGYAEAVVKDPDVPVNLCLPGKDAVSQKIARLTGKINAPAKRLIAHVKCAGTAEHALRIFEYRGVRKCVSANLLQGGNMACKFGCLGLGSCVSECVFDALSIGRNGMPVVNPEKCTGCGKCKNVCPKNVIEMVPVTAAIRVACNSQDKGATVRRNCKVGCIGCKLCEKSCPHSGIRVENNIAIINHAVCLEKCTEAVCIAKCPTKSLQGAVLGLDKVDVVSNRWI